MSATGHDSAEDHALPGGPVERTPHWWRRIGSILSVVALVVAVVLAGLMVLPSLLGYERYAIVSGSMAPEIPVGSVVYDEVVPESELAVGDIITFLPPPAYDLGGPVTHRIIEISTAAENSPDAGRQAYRTKGDANATADPWTIVLDRPEQARVVRRIKYMGYVYIALGHRWVQLLVIGLPALTIAILIAAAIWRESGDAVRAEHARAAATT